MVGYTDYVVYPVVQFILKVHLLLFSEDLGKSINSSNCICIHMPSCNFSTLSCLALCRIGNTEIALNDVYSSIDCCNWQ